MKRKYAKVLVKAAYIIGVDDLDIPELLEGINSEGKGKVESIEFVELNDDDTWGQLDKMLEGC